VGVTAHRQALTSGLAGCPGSIKDEPAGDTPAAEQRVDEAIFGLSQRRDPSTASECLASAGYEARHSSATKATGPRRGLVKRKAVLSGDLTPGPVIRVDGSVLAASHSGVLHALDPATGQQRWRFDGGGGYGSDLSTSPAVVGDGTIVWPGPNRTLFAPSASGDLLWTEQFLAQVLSANVARLKINNTPHGREARSAARQARLFPTPPGAVRWLRSTACTRCDIRDRRPPGRRQYLKVMWLRLLGSPCGVCDIR
jgi:PQQ-like domain